MGDEGFDSSRDAMGKIENSTGLYASVYADDAELGRLMEIWPFLNGDDRKVVVGRAERLASRSAGPDCDSEIAVDRWLD
jgi:hypothetical protein